jgi:hypothetical protein
MTGTPFLKTIYVEESYFRSSSLETQLDITDHKSYDYLVLSELNHNLGILFHSLG